jgi:hypothetical protein
MNLDPETLFALLDAEPRVPIVPTDSTPAVPTQDTGSDRTPSESIVGDHFFWASASVPVDLSQSSQVLSLDQGRTASIGVAMLFVEESEVPFAGQMR